MGYWQAEHPVVKPDPQPRTGCQKAARDIRHCCRRIAEPDVIDAVRDRQRHLVAPPDRHALVVDNRKFKLACAGGRCAVDTKLSLVIDDFGDEVTAAEKYSCCRDKPPAPASCQKHHPLSYGVRASAPS